MSFSDLSAYLFSSNIFVHIHTYVICTVCVCMCVCSTLPTHLLQQNILVFCRSLIIAGAQIWCTTSILAASGDVIVCGSESHRILFNTCLCHSVTWRPAVWCLTCCCPRLLSSSASVRDHQQPTPPETLMQIRRLPGSHWSACLIFYGYSLYTAAITSTADARCICVRSAVMLFYLLWLTFIRGTS